VPQERAPARDLAAWPEPLPVRDWMHEPVVTVRADTTVAAAVELMRSRALRHLPVTDAQGRLIGILTDRDLRQIVFDPAIQQALAGSTSALDEIPISRAMTWGVVTVQPATDLRAAAHLMRERKIGAVPVVDGNRVVGMLTETDVLAAFEQLLRARVVRPGPLRSGDEHRYDFGFPRPEDPDPWRDNGESP
jgi:acetoin utilization protein AcuB